MLNLSKIYFFIGHFLNYPKFFKLHKWLDKNQYNGREIFLKQQNFYLKRLIRYSYENVEFYHKTLKKINLNPVEIKTINDLTKLPIIDKNIIRNYYDEFLPKTFTKSEYIERSTGGTTGIPLRYRITRYNRFLAGALTYRMWKRANYILGDNILIIGGSSIVPNENQFLKKFITRIVRNALYLDSFNLSRTNFISTYKDIIKFNPKFIYGYPSAIEYFGNWLYNNGLFLKDIKGIVTTSEKLYVQIRNNIEKYFNVDVFDYYGLNDGGISAGECNEKNGLHIDIERGILEVIDNKTLNLTNEEGEIIATSLFNYAMPFIRYRTGDIGKLSNENNHSKCNINLPILEEIKGRTVDILITPEGNAIHGWFFLYIFWTYYEGIVQYKIEQRKKDEINIYIVPDKEKNYSKTLEKIQIAVNKRVPNWHLNFYLKDKISYENKRKFIINKIY